MGKDDKGHMNLYAFEECDCSILETNEFLVNINVPTPI